MKLTEIVNVLKLSPMSGSDLMDREVTGAYVSDLLSDVLANAETGNIWITLQTHLNIIPVAAMKELAAIIIVNGRSLEEQTLAKAAEEKVVIAGTDMRAFELAGRLYQLGIGVGDEEL